MTDDIAAQVKWLWENTPLNQAQISAKLGAINQGRVSEVISGQRFSHVQPMQFEGWNEHA
ncbi:hypothetical protein [Tateyamaria sp. SN6-1]|uniref:hypothetical protein n=1 Tax=Tateyamaria sp. SN6-1 TaxID=3092148 RepID=UPI0039F540EB